MTVGGSAVAQVCSGVGRCQARILALILHLPPPPPRLPVIITCILMCSSHICGIGLMVIASLSNRLRSLWQGGNSCEGQQRLFYLRGWMVLSDSAGTCRVGLRLSFLGSPLQLQHPSLFLRGTITILIWLSWFLFGPLCWCYSSSGGAGGKLAAIRTRQPFLNSQRGRSVGYTEQLRIWKSDRLLELIHVRGC